MAYRIAVAVSGRGSNLVALCDALAAETGVEVVLVVADRHVPALDVAQQRGISNTVLKDFRDGAEWCAVLEQSRADLLVLAGYLKLVPPEVVRAMPGKIINIHPALLPRYGGGGMYGSRVHAAVLEADEKESGATVHLVDEVYDRGPILGALKVPVETDDTVASLAQRVLAAEHRLLPAAVLAAAKAGHPVPFTIA